MGTNISGQQATDTTFVEASVLSSDGTKIGYRKYAGHGPALILVQGAMGGVVNYHELATALSNDFTVYVPERRGRQLSPKEYTPGHVIERDIEDLRSVLDESGAGYVFGLSSGAIITLEAAKVLPSIRKVAVYEPPFYVKGPVPEERIRRVFNLISQGNTNAALAHVFKIVKVGPRAFNYIPLPLLRQLTKIFISIEDNQAQGLYPKVSYLIPTMRFDFTAVLQRGGNAAGYHHVDKPVLLLGGTRSPRYLRDALDTLEKILPLATRISFRKLDHSAPWNKDRGGDPAQIAEALTHFFKSK